MIIALDYDGTYTAAPDLWDRFIADFIDNGHRVVCVTMRYPNEPIAMPCEIIYTSRQAKAKYLSGIMGIDIWIDDNPHWIFKDAV